MSEVETSVAKLLKEGEAVWVVTRGKSMLPLMREGKTQVIVEPVDRELAVGEMPVYMREDGAYILHRVVGMDERNYYIRGGNCVTMLIVTHRPAALKICDKVINFTPDGSIASVQCS